LRLESSDRVVRAWYGRPGYEWKNTNGNIVTLRVLNLPVQSESIRVCNSVLCCDPAPWYRKVLVVDVVPKNHPTGTEELVAISSPPAFVQQKLNAEFFEDAQDYYMLFGFVRFSDPSKEEVDAAFRACHKKYRCHPNWRQNNIESLSDEEKQFLMSQCLAIAKAHEVLSDPTKKKEYDKQLKEALGITGQLSCREKATQALLCAGIVIGGVVMLAIGFTIGGSALLSAAGGLIGAILGNSLINPAIEAGNIFVAGGWMIVSAVCTNIATETISDLGDAVGTKMTAKHIKDAMATGAEIAAETMKTTAEMYAASHWSTSSTAVAGFALQGGTFRPHRRPSLTMGTEHTRHSHEKHMRNLEVVEQRDLREEL